MDAKPIPSVHKRQRPEEDTRSIFTSSPVRSIALMFFCGCSSLYDRRLLGALSRCAWEMVRDLYGAGLEHRHAVPGMVVSIQSYGDLANWQPHLYALVSAGAFGREGSSHRWCCPRSAREARGGRDRRVAFPETLRVLGAPRDPSGTLRHGGRREVVPLPGASAYCFGAAAV
jgi:hypothetical protein